MGSLDLYVAAAPCWQLWASWIYCKKPFQPDLACPSAGLLKRVWWGRCLCPLL